MGAAQRHSSSAGEAAQLNTSSTFHDNSQRSASLTAKVTIQKAKRRRPPGRGCVDTICVMRGTQSIEAWCNVNGFGGRRGPSRANWEARAGSTVSNNVGVAQPAPGSLRGPASHDAYFGQPQPSTARPAQATRTPRTHHTSTDPPAYALAAHHSQGTATAEAVAHPPPPRTSPAAASLPLTTGLRRGYSPRQGYTYSLLSMFTSIRGDCRAKRQVPGNSPPFLLKTSHCKPRRATISKHLDPKHHPT